MQIRLAWGSFLIPTGQADNVTRRREEWLKNVCEQAQVANENVEGRLTPRIQKLHFTSCVLNLSMMSFRRRFSQNPVLPVGLAELNYSNIQRLFLSPLPFLDKSAARVACSNTSRTPSLVFAEHSR